MAVTANEPPAGAAEACAHLTATRLAPQSTPTGGGGHSRTWVPSEVASGPVRGAPVPRVLTLCASVPLQYEYSFRTEQSAAARLPPSPTRCQQIPQS